MPSSENVYVFNGDLVDRGDHSCEIVLLIFALKLSHPDAVFVNRGNHEEPHINIYSGFEEECVSKYDHRVFQTFHQAFVWLPYACLVNEKTLVLHAGLPADSKNVGLDDIRGIARGPDVCSEEANWGKERWIRDLTWSDPHPDPNFRGVEKSARGAGVLWGEDVTIEFFARNGLSALVRSHQCVDAGVDVAHGERVYTVFSASNYCGMSGNLGAVLIQRHGCDKPTETYQWDPREEAKMSAPVVSKRKSKEMRKAAAITQATEYIIEHRAALLEYFKRCDGKRTGAVSFHAWAKGLSQVLQVRLAWNQLVGGLVGPADMDDSCDGVLYEKWLGNFEVELKGGCKEWQHEVVSKISAAVFQNGGDLARAFAEMDADGSGEISPEEFRAAVRRRLPSLAVLSDAQLEAVVKAFDADGSGQVDVAEFEHLLNEHMAIASSRGANGEPDENVATKTDAAASPCQGENAEPSDSAEPSVREPTLRDTRNVIGIQWDTSFGRKAKATMADHMERTLADAIAHLFYTHRRELFHVWHATFDPDGTGSIAKDEFIASVRALDAAGGAQMLSEDALRGLAETLDSNGDGRIDFAEFSGNIGRIVERVHGAR
jgi:Ca2+-binding EF-hand superfamily protein/diadenosine tetraphosphatase ApaH/serine/threonine PP2A family protein phosphatase